MNLETARAAALEALGDRRVAVVAHDFWLASGLELALPGALVMCIQRCGAIDACRDRGVEVFCLSEHLPPEAVAGMSSVNLFEQPAAVEFIRGAGPLVVMGFKPSERLRAAVAAAGATLLNASAPGLEAARTFENKLAFVDIAARAGVRTPTWEVERDPLAVSWSDVSARLGESIVVQGPRGNAGQRTWLVSSREEWDALVARKAGGPVRAATHIDGHPFTASGVVGSSGMGGWTEPCRQVTGVPWLTPMALGSCGNAWPDEAASAHTTPIYDALRRLGEALGDTGYRGVFGADFVMADSGPVVIETNPRMVASLAFGAQLEVAAGRAPLLLLHLLAGLDALDGSAFAEAAPLGPASQVIVHLLPGDPEARPSVPSGVYAPTPDGGFELRREGAYLGDLVAENEVLVLAREAGEPVTEGREFARVYMPDARAETHPAARRIAEALRGTAVP